MLHGLHSMESCIYEGMDSTVLERQQARLKLQENYVVQNNNPIELCANSVPQFQGFNERCLGSDDFHKFVNFSVAGPDFVDSMMNMMPQEVAADYCMAMEPPTGSKSFNKRKAEAVDDKCKDKRIKREIEMESEVKTNNPIELCANSVPQFQGFNERCLGSDDFHKFVNFSVAGPDFVDSMMNMMPQEVAADYCMAMEPPTGSKSFNKRKAEAVDDKCKDKRIKREIEMESEVKTKCSTDVSRNSSMENSKALEVKKPDYIHVRARRGQATDSHSLAERARREKISKKMKCLQDLVPGCNKITGKAGMLDEIINYVQSLQKQVEFLSMKLAAQNPTAEFHGENLPMKEVMKFASCVANFPAAVKSPAMASLAFLQLNPMQKEAINCIMNSPQTATEGITSASLSIPDQALSSSCISQLQPYSAWNTDPLGLHNVYNMGFH